MCMPRKNMSYEHDSSYITYDNEDGSDAVFIRRHEGCGLIVKPDETIAVHQDSGLKDQPNATCKKHGRVKMEFEGFF